MYTTHSILVRTLGDKHTHTLTHGPAHKTLFP